MNVEGRDITTELIDIKNKEILKKKDVMFINYNVDKIYKFLKGYSLP